MKKRVLIVEDDKYFRFAIKKMILWEKYGMEVVGEAVHGESALSFVKNYHVDIVLTDMKMPVMDGIKLTRILHREYPEIMVFALSAYDDLDFVKESLRLGAKDYLLKQDIEKEDVGKKIYDAWDIFLKDSIKDGKFSRDILDTLKGRLKDPSNRVKQFLKFVLSDKEWYLCMIKNLNEDWKSEQCLEWRWFQESLLELHERDIHLIFISASSCPSMAEQIEEINSIISHIDSFLEEENYLLACSNRMTHPSDLCFVYQDTEKLLEIGRFQKNKRHITKDGIPNRKRILDFMYDKKKVSKSYSCDRNLADLRYLTEDLRRYMPDEEHIQMSYLNFIIDMALIAEYEIGNLLFAKMKDELSAQYMLDGKHNVAETFVKQIFEANNDRHFHRSIKQGIEFMRENYSKEISLQDISEFVSMNESYFSSLFKKETGKSVIEYLNGLRIQKAKELLAETSLKNYEVGEKVGIVNASYFSTLFKKETGYTIQEYKYKFFK